MISKEAFCSYMDRFSQQYKKETEFFDKIEEFINFEPFYEVNYWNFALEGIALAFNEKYINELKDILYDWVEEKLCLYDMEDREIPIESSSELYDYLYKTFNSAS